MSTTPGTFVAKPFITKDGADPQGIRAEVKVLTGYGDIKETKTSAGGKMTNIVFTGENFRYDQNGWAQNDTDLFKKIEEAEKNSEAIHFRIEYRRKESIDRSIPFNEMGTENNMSKAKDMYFKSLAAVRADSDDDWTFAPNAVTNPNEDPSMGGIIPAGMGAVVKDSPSQDFNAPKYDNLVEPPRWVSHKADGSLNLGSAASAVVINTYGFVMDLRSEKELDFLDSKKARTLTRLLVRVASKIQVNVYSEREDALESADLSLESHTRARAIVFNLVKNMHLPTDEVLSDKESFREYAESLTEEGTAIFQWGISETEKLLG